MIQIRPMPNLSVAAHRQLFGSRSFRLEEEFPEETEVLEIEIEISEDGKTEHGIAEPAVFHDLKIKLFPRLNLFLLNIGDYDIL